MSSFTTPHFVFKLHAGCFVLLINVVTLTLGSRPKQGLPKVRAKNEARESHFMLMGM